MWVGVLGRGLVSWVVIDVARGSVVVLTGIDSLVDRFRAGLCVVIDKLAYWRRSGCISVSKVVYNVGKYLFF